jgi:hypothetical protein
MDFETDSEFSYSSSWDLLDNDTATSAYSTLDIDNNWDDYYEDHYSGSIYNNYDYDDQRCCVFCRPRPRDDCIAEAQSLHDDTTSHFFTPYRDLRSAARTKRRKRQDRRRCHSYRCRKQSQAEAATAHLKSKRMILRTEILESQNELCCYTRGFFPAKHRVIEWDTSIHSDLDAEIASMDDIERYQEFHQGADVFESPLPFIEVGEDFTTWCLRRIAEMRAVKEFRLARGTPQHVKPAIWQRKRDARSRKQIVVYIGDETSTTLPTNAYNALGHELLRSVLAPKNWWHRQRMSNAELLHGKGGYRWFGEYTWQWYRNGSGCWELGYGGEYWCEECGGMSWSAKHKECVEREREIGPAPEEAQRCCLVEWVGREGRDLILREERDAMFREDGKEMELDDENMVGVVGEGEAEEGHGWDLVSIASSEAWSVVDACI